MLPSRGLINALRTTGNRPASVSRTVRQFSNRVQSPLAQPPRLQSRAWQAQRRNLSWFGGSGVSQAPPGVNVHRDGAVALSTPIKAPDPVSALDAPPALASTPNPPLDPSAISGFAPAHDVLDRPAYDHNLEVIDGWTAPVTEHIGYLHSLGLDYGWGPTSTLQWTLEHVHIYGGLPWWGSIIVTSVLVRLALFPFMLKSSEAQARMNIIKPHLNPLQETLVAAYKDGNSEVAQQTRRQMETLRARAGISVGAMFGPMVLNTVFGYCGFKLMNGMASLPVPSFLTGGTAWFADLSLSDPYYIIPAFLGASTYFSIKMNADGFSMSNGPTQASGFQKVILYAFPALVTITMSFLSTGTALWFGASMIISVITTRMMNVPAFRQWAQMTPMTPGTANVSAFSNIQDNLQAAEASTKAKQERIIEVQRVREQGAARYQAPRQPRAARNDSGIPGMTDDIMRRAGLEGKDRSQMTTLERYIAWSANHINNLGDAYGTIAKVGKKLLGRK